MNIALNAIAGIIMTTAGIMLLNHSIADYILGIDEKPSQVDTPRVGDMYAWRPGGDRSSELTMAALAVVVAPPKDNDVEVVYVFVGPRGQAILAERTSKEPLSLFGYNSGFQRVLRGKGGIDADILPPKP